MPCPAAANFEATRDLPKIWAALQAKRAKASDASSDAGTSSGAVGGGAGIELQAPTRAGVERQPPSASADARDTFAAAVGRVFDQVDTNRDGVLSWNECRALVQPVLQSSGIEASDANIKLTIAAVTAMSSSLDHVELTRACFVERMSGFRDRAIAMRHVEGTEHAAADDADAELLSMRTKNRRANGICLTFKHTFERNIRQIGRHTNDLVFDAILAVVPALVISLIFTAKWDEFTDAPLIVFLCFLVLCLIQVIATIRILASERMLFYREVRRLDVLSTFVCFVYPTMRDRSRTAVPRVVSHTHHHRFVVLAVLRRPLPQAPIDFLRSPPAPPATHSTHTTTSASAGCMSLRTSSRKMRSRCSTLSCAPRSSLASCTPSWSHSVDTSRFGSYRVSCATTPQVRFFILYR